MIRTGVRATARGRPRSSSFTSHACAVPLLQTVGKAGPLTARNFFVRSKQRTVLAGTEERCCRTGTAQVKAGNHPGFYSAHHRPLKTWGFTHCIGMSKLLSGRETLWAHQRLVWLLLVHGTPCLILGHRSLTFTTMVFPNGPVKEGEQGSDVGVILKQRPQAPPAALFAPNASSFTAVEYPYTIWPQAGG